MAEERLKQLRQLRNKYISLLGDTFHMVNPDELARASLNPEYDQFVDDYLHLVCSSEYREAVAREIEKLSQLEASAQSQPSCTEPTDVSIAGTLAEGGYRSPGRLSDRHLDPTYP